MTKGWGIRCRSWWAIYLCILFCIKGHWVSRIKFILSAPGEVCTWATFLCTTPLEIWSWCRSNLRRITSWRATWNYSPINYSRRIASLTVRSRKPTGKDLCLRRFLIIRRISVRPFPVTRLSIKSVILHLFRIAFRDEESFRWKLMEMNLWRNTIREERKVSIRFFRLRAWIKQKFFLRFFLHRDFRVETPWIQSFMSICRELFAQFLIRLGKTSARVMLNKRSPVFYV